ncbi:hypothetical protein [Paraclostridium bifermentans]|uniref:hypothetical protein n=1 Tax=Paraclostridium bifermentans TaxID=1490 RepID=UPI001898D831|nr:hypothetical protein [Paraclostridium bifermentans]
MKKRLENKIKYLIEIDADRLDSIEASMKLNKIIEESIENALEIIENWFEQNKVDFEIILEGEF